MRNGHFQKTGSKFYLLTVFLVFFSVYSNQNNLFAQISIRETVALNPKTLNTEGPDYDILTLDDYLCLDEQTFIVISAEVDFFELYQDSVITLEIISGNKSASFYGMSSFAGDTVSILIRRLDYIRIQHDSSGGSSATIKATINNVVRTTDVYLSCGGGGEGECSLETYPLANTNTLYPGESFMMGAELFGSCPDQDPDFSYNVRIIQGSAYGTLLNIYTGEKADQFNGIQPYDLNWLNFLFLADGEVPESSKEVKIQISTNNPLFPSSNLSLIVNPSIEPMIQIVPSVLEPGDTADVYIKNRNEDFSLSDFPPEATFEVGMLDGCVNGTILTEEGTGSYFSDVPLPIKFIATDTGTVKLRAGVLPMSGGASISVKGKEHVFDLKEIYKRLHSSVNMEKQKVNKSIKSSADINEDACYTGPFWSFLSGDVVVKVSNDDCNQPEWVCESGTANKTPKFEILPLPNGTDGIDVCANANGMFKPLYDTELFDFNIEPCYNPQKDQWNFIPQNNTVKIRAITDICLEKFNSDILINNVNELISKIPDDEVKYALKDFEAQKIYINSWGIPSDAHSPKYKFYWIAEWLMIHEKTHQMHYQNKAINIIAAQLNNRFNSMWKPACEDFKNLFHSNIEELSRQGNSQITGILNGTDKDDPKSFKTNLREKWEEYINQKEFTYVFRDGSSLTTDFYEQYTQFHVYEIINKYVEELKKRL